MTVRLFLAMSAISYAVATGVLLLQGDMEQAGMTSLMAAANGLVAILGDAK